eukprot:6410727-Pyramimonas_sp.AAC.1
MATRSLEGERARVVRGPFAAVVGVGQAGPLCGAPLVCAALSDAEFRGRWGASPRWWGAVRVAADTE